MYSLLYKICSWLLQKLAAAALIVGLGLAAYGLWLFLRETVDFDTRRTELVQALTDERDHLQALRADLERRLGELQADIVAQEERAERAAKVVAALRSLESWWDRWFGNPEQQKANADQIRRMEELRGSATARVAELRQAVLQTTWEREGLEIALARAERRLAGAEQSESRVAHYFRRAWDEMKWYVVAALAGLFFGPSLFKLFLFYGLAPVLARSRPIRFVQDDPPALPAVGESRVSVDAALWPGERLHVKEKFLQASDEGLSKQTRLLLDWRIPFTSLACGLAELVEMRNTTAVGGLHVTFSNADDPHTELSLVDVPEGASLILRPRFLVGVITRADRPLRIRRRWQLLRWQSWLTLQFRFFEFTGPCRLLVAGSRGVRAELLAAREDRPSPARRTNQEATIGFTPNLDYRPVRAETFWGYYRGMNPLFDDLFAGTGLFLVQETASAGAEAKAGRFWSAVWNGVLKVFGL